MAVVSESTSHGLALLFEKENDQARATPRPGTRACCTDAGPPQGSVPVAQLPEPAHVPTAASKATDRTKSSQIAKSRATLRSNWPLPSKRTPRIRLRISG